LKRHGFEQATPIQAQAIPPALEGRDVLGTAQTGTGKTLAFLIPMIERLAAEPRRSGVRAAVLSPTRELALQIEDTFRKLAAGTGLRAAAVVGGIHESGQLKALRQGAQVAIATPGRLADFLDRGLVKLGGVEVLVLDEADRMLDMGFLPVIRRILKETPQSRQTLFFSATLEKSVQGLVAEHLNNPARISLGAPTKVADNVDLHLYEVEPHEKQALLDSLIRREQGSVLVFARTRHGTDRLARNLERGGVKAARIHGDRTQSQRLAALKGFQEGRYRVLVATDVAARGIHVDGVAHVVNYDPPRAAEDFIHRVGRTARAGASGTASTISTRPERSVIRQIERELEVRLRRVPAPVR
jgi:ATP-dependent RNA helicase RhlE